VFAVMGVLPGAGVSDAVAYGLYPGTVPLIAADVGGRRRRPAHHAPRPRRSHRLAAAPPKTTVALTSHGRTALDAYTQALRDLLGGL
jgi:hypothetical protein